MSTETLHEFLKHTISNAHHTRCMTELPAEPSGQTAIYKM